MKPTGYFLDSDSESKSLSFLVAIIGARMHYAVPAILAQRNMLARFYTDFYLSPRMHNGLIGEPFNKLPFRFCKRMAGRYDERLPIQSVRSFNGIGVAYTAALYLAQNSALRERCYQFFGSKFARLVAKELNGGFSALYGMNGTSLEMFARAKEIAIPCILEQCIVPYAIEKNLLREEYELWPGWERKSVTFFSNATVEREYREWELADLIVAGSQFVVDGLVACGVNSDKCQVLQYTVDTQKYQIIQRANAHPKSNLKILFLGNVTIRKGIQYLYTALKILDSKCFQVKVAGGLNILPEVQAKLAPFCELLGLVPRDEVPNLLQWADVLVLPSICEGSALATYEALAAGLPVITTPNSGSVVRDGVDGYIIPNRDPETLAAKLSELIDRPELRVHMGQNARRHALEELSWDAYTDRFLRMVQDFVVGLIPNRSNYLNEIR